MTVEDLLDRLTSDRPALIRRQAEADRVLGASSAGHLVHEMNVHRRPWRVDPVPFVLDGATFERLATGIVERAAAMERILADLYGPRNLVADGVVPGEALSSSKRYRIGSVGLSPPRRWLTTYAADVVHLTDGTWRIVRDLADAPTGVGYTLLDRAAMLPVDMPGVDKGVASLAGVPAALRHALVANTAVASPRIALLSGGVEHTGYVEDSQLARLLGFTLIERADVVVRQGRLWLRTLGGLDPIDVVYRRIGDDETDPIELAAPGGSGVPGLLSAVADRGVVLANAHGCGVVEDFELAQFWPAAAESLTGSSLRLPQLGDAARTAQLRTVPAFRGAELQDVAVVVRLHAVAGPDGVTVVPGGNGRVLAPGDDPQRPTARTVKDVWVLDQARSLPAVLTPLPQVDLAGSVPTRAVDALFWMGRAAERAEAIARTLRVVAGRRRLDPTLVVLDGGRWSARIAAALRAVGGIEPGGGDRAERGRGSVLELDSATLAATHQLGARLRSFVAEAASVGEFLPGSTARVLTDVAQRIESFAGDRVPDNVDVLDEVLASLAAFAGMWNESTVRGPAWRFGDIGIRLERALVVLALADSLIGDADPSTDVLDAAGVAAVEVLLAANESLVAYRRQHRSDVALRPAHELLIRDRDNPRGCVTCLERSATHSADVGWYEGTTAVSRIVALITNVNIDELASTGHLDAVSDAVAAFAADVGATWFATPVKPMLMHAGRAASSTAFPGHAGRD
ncbi:MAG: circularly permuted type 2 ATP-grasp protein [Ilumatobacteraceae bacterium]